MRLVTYSKGTGSPRLGAWIDSDSHIVDLEVAAELRGDNTEPYGSMLALIQAGDGALKTAKELVNAVDDKAVQKTGECTILAPLLDPLQIRDFLCFEQHLKNVLDAAIEMQARRADDPEAMRKQLQESGAFIIPNVWYKKPLYYTCSRNCIAGPDAEVTWPAYSQMRDYELEFAAIIGKAGKDISRESAADHIFGYTLFNDLSARDEQFIVMEGKLGPGKGKDFDQGNVFGPCIVTADEIGDPYDLTMLARVNDEEWSRGSSSTMTHKFEDVIAEVSRAETIQPGEIFGSGTVGTGSGIEKLRFLNDGDVIELEMEKIGVLRTKILT